MADLIQSWTPEQQRQELLRRDGIVGRIYSNELKLRECFDAEDVVVATPMKSGTTWLTHICHQIRMQGAEPDFEDQYEVMQYVEGGKSLVGGMLNPNNKPQPARPHIFHTHLPYEFVPRKCKLIFCYRDPKDVVVSMHHFINSQYFLRGRVSLTLFAEMYLSQQILVNSLSIQQAIKNLVYWWEHRNDPNIMLIFFEDLKEDHAGCVRRIAEFINVDCSEEVLARVVHTTSHAVMAQQSSKFNSSNHIAVIAKALGESVSSDEEFVGRVRKDGGGSGDGQSLPVDIQQQIDMLWQEIVTRSIGFKTYSELHCVWQSEHQSWSKISF